MNLAHIHLILTHIPIVGIPMALAFLGHGIYQKSTPTQRSALYAFVFTALIVLPVYFTGEPAEEIVEHFPGVAESFIETHEEAALFSLILTLITGVAAIAGLIFHKDTKKSRILNIIVMGLACLSVLSLFYTANLGGQIRHTEMRSSLNSQGVGEIKEGNEEKNEKDDD